VTQLHPQVLAIAKRFRAAGLPSPEAIERKAGLFTPNFVGERLCVVASDVVRCSTTILTALAAGAAAVTITVKGSECGTAPSEAKRVATLLDLPLVFGGELHGRPIEGGVIGNSPREVKASSVRNTLLHFQSTNFGAAFTGVVPRIKSFNESGGLAKLLIGSFANIEALAGTVDGFHYDRIFVACGGFYNSASFEDEVFGGELLNLLNIDPHETDDEARLMIAGALLAGSMGKRIDHFQTNWIGRALQQFGMAGDIAAVVSGDGINPTIYERMRSIVPFLEFVDGIPVIFPAARLIDRPSAAELTLVTA
jgi:phosphosulfolactate phosphohydrolase-like enzyme